jgi:hypothetical protein
MLQLLRLHDWAHENQKPSATQATVAFPPLYCGRCFHRVALDRQKGPQCYHIGIHFHCRHFCFERVVLRDAEAAIPEAARILSLTVKLSMPIVALT